MVNKVTGIFVAVIIVGIACAKLNDELLEKKKANTFIKSRQRRSLKSGLNDECCPGICSFEERAEFSEDHGWSAVGSTLCQLSMVEDRNCRCRARSGSLYRCSIYDGSCRSTVCNCGGTKDKGWEFVGVTYDTPSGTVNQRPLEASTHTIDNIGGGSLAPSTSFTTSKQVTETESFSKTSGTSLTVGTEFKVGVPLVADATVKVEISISSSRTIGRSKSVAKTITNTFNCPAKQGLFVTCKAIVMEAVISVPYTMRLRNKHFGCECTNHGVYKKVQYSSMHLKVAASTTRPPGYFKRELKKE